MSKNTTPLVALLFLVLLGSACEQKIEGLGIKLNLNEQTLSNGLKVILVENHTVPVVSYQTWFRVGSVDEKLGQTGISHFFEHLMFKGTAKFGPKEYFTRLESKGAEVNAFTTRDYTVYYETCTPDLLNRVIEMEADRLGGLKLNDQIIETERQVVFEERRLQVDNSPTGKMQEALWALAYHRHPYQWPIGGLPQDLLKLSAPMLQTWFNDYYQPANATLVIVGDFKTNEIMPLIKKAYEPITKRPRPKRVIPDEPAQNEERRLILRDRVPSERFAHAYHITAATNDESYALDVLANILFEGTHSRAYRRLVDDQELALSVSGSAYTPTYPGLFIISVSMKNGMKGTEGETAINELIREIQNNGVTEQEVAKAIRQLTVQMVDSVQTPFGLGQLIGAVATIFDDPRRFADDLAKYTRVTPADVQKAAEKYLFPNNRSVVLLTPEVAQNKKGTR